MPNSVRGAAQDGPAALHDAVASASRSGFAEGVGYSLAPLGKRLARDGDRRPCDHRLAFAVLAERVSIDGFSGQCRSPAQSRGAVLRSQHGTVEKMRSGA